MWSKSSAIRFKTNCALLLTAYLIAALPASAAIYTPNTNKTSAPETTNKAPTSSFDWCPALVKRLPKISLAECRASKFNASGINSFNGFPIITRDVAAKASQKKPVKVLLIGGIHGDELTASAIIFKWVAHIGKPTAQTFQWKIAPVVNPDGLLATKPQRVNARGVDLNRNFPTPNWEVETAKYWSKVTKKDPRRFPGKAPISEPESRWVHDTIEHYKPDVIISVHAPFGVLDFDGPATPPKRFGRLAFTPVGVYPGSLGNYSGLHKDIPVVTIELPNATVMPSDAETFKIWADMLGWITRNVKAAR
jgi:murein peptide amidase A